MLPAALSSLRGLDHDHTRCGCDQGHSAFVYNACISCVSKLHLYELRSMEERLQKTHLSARRDRLRTCSRLAPLRWTYASVGEQGS